MTIELPEDMSEWPASPWRLLGLDNNASNSDVRKAYAKLVRRFRPESHPAEFQRINQAYELLRSLGNRKETAPPEQSHAFAGETGSENKNTTNRGYEERFDPFDVFAAFGDDSVQKAWSKLTQRHQSSSSMEITAAMYWLLVLDPTLDTEHDRLKFLCQGILANGRKPVLYSLLLRELALHSPPSTWRAEEIDSVLKATTPYQTSELLVARWKHLSKSNDRSWITTDLEQYRQEFMETDPVLWVRMLVSIVGIFAWEENESSKKMVAGCRREISGYTELQIQAEAELDRLDRLDDLLAARQASRQIHQTDFEAMIFSSIPKLWFPDTDRVEPLVQLCLTLTTETPFRLTRLDDIGKTGPAVLNFIFEVLQQELQALAYTFDFGTLTDRIVLFHTLAKARRYSGFRDKILKFCIRECVYPEWIARVLERQTPSPTIESAGQVEYVSEAILNDTSLRVLSLAHLYLLG